ASTTDTSGHAQVAWSTEEFDCVGTCGSRRSLRIRAFAGYTQRARDNALLAPGTPAVFERLLDGPVAAALLPNNSTVSRFSGGVRVEAPTGARHQWESGVELGYTRDHSTAGWSRRLGELLDGIPARAYDLATTPSGDPRPHRT